MKQLSDSELKNMVDAYIHREKEIYVHSPKGLYTPIEYVLGLKGKRMRPLLMLMAYNLYQEKVEPILPQAMAMEVYHNFTLLHDDLMDKADMRRGNPTVHRKWGENAAILSGDAMLILSYSYMTKGCPSALLEKIMQVFGKAALEVCEGQQWDMDFEKLNNVTIDEYLEMIRLKTSVLLAASLQIGAILGGASEADALRLYDFGIRIGLAFQLQDDYLDVYGDPQTFGKNIGGDILCNKKTFLLLSAMELVQGTRKRELNGWMQVNTVDPSEKISRVTAIFNKVGVDKLCLQKIAELYAEGFSCLDAVEVAGERKQCLRNYVDRLMNRNL